MRDGLGVARDLGLNPLRLKCVHELIAGCPTVSRGYINHQAA